MQRHHRLLIGILLAGFVLRLLFALTATVDWAELGGGDTRWYISNGVALLSGEVKGTVYGLPVDVSQLPTAPLYLIFTGFFVRIFPLEIALVSIRLLQVLMGVATCYFAYAIMRRIADDVRVGLVAAALLSFAPALILEPRELLTETAYIFTISGGIWAYVVAVDAAAIKWRWLALSGILLALATLTRAVSLLFPIGLAALLILTFSRKGWRQGLLAALLLLSVYTALASTWTIYNALAYNRFVIGSSQLMPSIWRGAAIDLELTPQESDEILGEATYSEQTTESITTDPTRYMQRRFNEVLQAYLQPHGTTPLGGDSLKAMAQEWVQSGFSIDGLRKLGAGEGFWPKLAIYIWHYAGLLLGIIGIGLTRQRWQLVLTLIGFILYTTLLHLIVLALPRYIFPAMICFWLFAAVTLVWVWDYFRKSVNEAK